MEAQTPATRPKLRFEPGSNALIPEIIAFNQRLDAAGVATGFRFGTEPQRDDYAEQQRSCPVWRETVFVVEGDAVRGGVILQYQRFQLANAIVPIINVQLPISEGLADARYGFLGMWIIKNVVQKNPLVFAVGMGGMNQPLPKLLSVLGWDVRPVPFFFYVHHVKRFLIGMPRLNQTRSRKAIAHAAAASGTGWLTLRILHTLARIRQLAKAKAPSLGRPTVQSERIDAWGAWANTIWDAARSNYVLVGAKDQDALQALYPPSDKRYFCHRLRQGHLDIGWVVLIVSTMRNNQHFGNLRVGTLLDCLAQPGYERDVVRQARRLMNDFDVDISVCNVSHVRWQNACRAAGYLSASSNFLLAMSKPLTQSLYAAKDDPMSSIHVTRGDGDGRIHL